MGRKGSSSRSERKVEGPCSEELRSMDERAFTLGESIVSIFEGSKSSPSEKQELHKKAKQDVQENTSDTSFQNRQVVEELIAEINSAVLFKKENGHKVHFIQDPYGKNGQIFQCHSENMQDIIFEAKGTIQYPSDLCITPNIVSATRRSDSASKIDRYTVNLTLSPEDCEVFTSAARVVLQKFEEINGPKKVAIRMNMRDTEENFEMNKIKAKFPAVSDAYFNFYFTRFVSWRGQKLDTKDYPPFPAGIPSRDEMIEANVRIGPDFYNLLPLIPLFKEYDSGQISLIDARKLHLDAPINVRVIFRLKQCSSYFPKRHDHNDFVEKISIEPSIIAVVFSKAQKKKESALEILKKRRTSSF